MYLVFYGYYACILTKIPHLVKTGANVESCACTQRCRLSHNDFFFFFFFLYLAVHKRQQLNTPIVYFPDDTGLIKLKLTMTLPLTATYIRSSVDWCVEDYLQFQGVKTEQIHSDFKRYQRAYSRLKLKEKLFKE